MLTDRLLGSSEQRATFLPLSLGEMLQSSKIKGADAGESFRKESGCGFTRNAFDFLDALCCQALKDGGLDSLCVKTLVGLSNSADGFGLSLSNGSDGLGFGFSDLLHALDFSNDFSLFLSKDSVALADSDDSGFPRNSIGILQTCLDLESGDSLFVHGFLIGSLVVHTESDAQQSTTDGSGEFSQFCSRDSLQVIGERGTVVVWDLRGVLELVSRQCSDRILEFQSHKFFQGIDEVNVLSLSSEDARFVKLNSHIDINVHWRRIFGVDANGRQVLSIFLHVRIAEELDALFVDHVLSRWLLPDGVAGSKQTNVPCRDLDKGCSSIEFALYHLAIL
mmetsp:Transcript_3148/g.6167  ORF Transcript_3148/g.6167 Transcript_3148/m.6167 type:complete len:335 (+) Transcript_3148:357-1361(+)